MNQPPVEKDTRTVAETPAPAENRPAGEDKTRTAVLGPFGLRDLVVGGSVLLMLIGSLLPWNVSFDLQVTLWSPLTPLFFLGIGIILPLLVAGLFAARRMAPELKYRIGSLSVDQFGSVVGVLALAFFFLQLVTEFTVGTLLTFIGALGLVAATTLAPHIPPFSREFDERAEMPAHVMARDAVRLRRRPAAPAAPATPATPARTSEAGASVPADAEAASAESRPAESRPAGSRFAGMGTKLAPTGLFGRKSDAGTPAPNGIPEGSAPAAGATAVGATAATTPSSGNAVGSETGSSETSGGDTSGSDISGAEPDRSESAAVQSAPAATTQAAAPAPRREDAIAATTVNPVVPAQQSRAASPETSQSEVKRFEAEPATQASPLISPSSSGDSISATREESENVVEAFWFAVGTPRQIVDERTGLPLFMFHPGDWELGLEDRGNEFLVQDKRTGRIGVLRDLSNIERVGEDSGE
ncbi:hypothetical protein QNO08_15135 [Arthrobacter sp. zg-Y820]|uniref:hypothetical protein n=1 Tax=unclassified Arthrobacter TaxID=235627 RepID=UPI001E4DFBC0|nr:MULTISPECIES: hypothetical protein [unclassified Arthrobacter]MCC9196974.1 hypothetical protein [Arthrobacter sp. zg-Y820]MDK1279839.1 hypothetical protein [Arthrobacter sp. zg.Y820]WIB09144.1 hypothetical protein QNO08_15135 [Arthrobacter sp. zg-Y820]